MTADPSGPDVTLWARRAAIVLGLLVVAALVWGAVVWWQAERSLDRQSLDTIEHRDPDPPEGDEAALGDDVLNVLVVGSDDRAGLTEEERDELRTGEFDGEQTDTILLVQTTPEGMSIVSFPRDLKVQLGEGSPAKINSVLQDHGRDALVDVVEQALAIEIDHYVEVAITSFLEIVDSAGGVEVCLDEPLRDPKSGADFEAGCHDMDGVDALSYVRSRVGERADFQRVERQQQFLRALADKATSLSVLANPVRLRNVVTDVSDGLTVDSGLTVGRMLDLANALRRRLEEGLEATTLPAYPAEENGIAYVVAYPPGVEAVARALQRTEPLPELPDAEELSAVGVGIWSAGAPTEASAIESLLFFAGFEPAVLGSAPDLGDETPSTTVFHAPGAEEEAAWVASRLGAPVEPLPTGFEPPGGREVIVLATEREPTTVGGVLAPPA